MSRSTYKKGIKKQEEKHPAALPISSQDFYWSHPMVTEGLSGRCQLRLNSISRIAAYFTYLIQIYEPKNLAKKF